MTDLTTEGLEQAPQMGCVRCGAAVSEGQLRDQTAIRLLGRLICPACRQSPPVVTCQRQGLPRRVFRVPHPRFHQANRYTFLTAAHLSLHRRSLLATGQFPAPMLPSDGSGMQAPSNQDHLRRLALPVVGALAGLGMLLVFAFPRAQPPTPANPEPAVLAPAPNTTLKPPAPLPLTAAPAPQTPDPIFENLNAQLQRWEQALLDGSLAHSERAAIADVAIPTDLLYSSLALRRTQLLEQLDQQQAQALLQQDRQWLAQLERVADTQGPNEALAELARGHLKSQNPQLREQLQHLQQRWLAALTPEAPLTAPPEVPTASPSPPSPDTAAAPVPAPASPNHHDPASGEAGSATPAPPPLVATAAQRWVDNRLPLVPGSGRALNWFHDPAPPSGLPGGLGPTVYASRSSSDSPQQQLQLLIPSEACAQGGVVLVLHPGDPRRETLQATLTLADGSSVALGTLRFASQTWQRMALAVPTTRDLLGEQARLTVLDVSGSSLPFWCAGLVAQGGSLPDERTLALHPRTLLVQSSAFKKRLSRIDEQRRKLRLRAQRLDASSLMLIFAEAARNDALREQLPPFFAARAATVGGEACLPFWTDSSSLDNELKQKRPSIVVLFPYDAGLGEPDLRPLQQALRTCLEQGTLPIVALGPYKVAAKERAQAEQNAQAILALLNEQFSGIPGLDLRSVPLRSDGAYAPGGAEQAAQLVYWGLAECFERLGSALLTDSR